MTNTKMVTEKILFGLLVSLCTSSGYAEESVEQGFIQKLETLVRNWSSDPRENPVAVFVSDTAVSEYYHISEISSSEPSHDDVYQLIPKLDNGSYSELQVTFNSQGIESMKVLDSLGQTTSVQFRTLTEEEVTLLPDSPYQFIIPEKAELIFDE